MGSMISCFIRNCCGELDTDDDSDDNDNEDEHHNVTQPLTGTLGSNSNTRNRRQGNQQDQSHIYSDSSVVTIYNVDDQNNESDDESSLLVIPRSHSRVFRSAVSSVDDSVDNDITHDPSEFIRMNSPQMLNNDTTTTEWRQEPESQLSTTITSAMNDSARHPRNTRMDMSTTLDDDDDEEYNDVRNSDGRTNTCCLPSVMARDNLPNNTANQTRSGSGNIRGTINNIAPRLPPEAKQHVDSINSFFRKIRDKFQTTTSTTYDSFTTVAASWNNNNNTQQQYNNFINQTARGISNTRDRARSSNHHHDSRPLMSRSVSDGADGGGSSNGGAANTTSRPIRIHRNKSVNSPLKQAQSFDVSKDMISISPAEIVLPGSLLQREMAEKMKATLEAEKESKRRSKNNKGTEGDAVEGDATADEMNNISIENDNDNDEDDECVICMEGFDHTNPRMPTLCGCGENKTYFHLPCLYQWIEQSRHCPTCRQTLTWEEY